MRIVELYVLPKETANMLLDIEISSVGRRSELSLSYGEDFKNNVAGFFFVNTIELRFMSGLFYPPEAVEQAFDTLVELEGSDYLSEYRKYLPEDVLESRITRHFRFYGHPVGGFDIIAADWGVM